MTHFKDKESDDNQSKTNIFDESDVETRRMDNQSPGHHLNLTNMIIDPNDTSTINNKIIQQNNTSTPEVTTQVFDDLRRKEREYREKKKKNEELEHKYTRKNYTSILTGHGIESHAWNEMEKRINEINRCVKVKKENLIIVQLKRTRM